MRQELTKSACPFCGQPTYYKTDDGTFCCFSCFKQGPDFISEVCGLHEPTEAPGILDEAVVYFQNHLKNCSYARKRKITGDVARRFRLGFADGHLCNELIKTHSENEIVAAGLGKNVNGVLTDTFRNRLMFPIMTSKSLIVGFGGRKVDDLSPAPKYLNSIDMEFFNKKNCLYGIHDTNNFTTIYLVEGYMDVVSLHKNGINNAVAALGTAVGRNHALLLKGLGCKKVIVALDSDDPGIQAAVRAIKVLKEYFEVYVLNVPDTKDADEYLKKHTRNEFEALATIPANEYILSHCDVNVDTLLSTLS